MNEDLRILIDILISIATLIFISGIIIAFEIDDSTAQLKCLENLAKDACREDYGANYYPEQSNTPNSFVCEKIEKHKASYIRYLSLTQDEIDSCPKPIKRGLL